ICVDDDDEEEVVDDGEVERGEEKAANEEVGNSMEAFESMDERRSWWACVW
ncbi:hypothetical protein HK104_008274, partial [Borealophlyctis nickersoniae]